MLPSARQYNKRSCKSGLCQLLDLQAFCAEILASGPGIREPCFRNQSQCCRDNPKHSNLNFGQNRDNDAMHLISVSATV